MTEFMAAARMHRIGEKLRLDRVRIPTVGPDDVLVAVKRSGICHSDINYLRGIVPVRKLPITLGHEIAGIVSKTGRKVRAVKKDDRICVHYVVHCGHCHFCQTNRENYCTEYRMMGKDVDGGFAQYATVPSNSIVKLPEAIPFEQGAILGCAVPTAFHALRRGRTQVGDTVAIFGIGGLGIHAVQLAAKIFKAGNIVAVDLQDAKLKLAKRLGANELVNATHTDPIEAVRQITNGTFADVVIDFVGQNSTIEKAIQCVGKGGRMVLVGIGSKLMQLSPYRTLIGKEIEILGVNDHLMTELIQLVKLVLNRKVDLSNSVTHRVPLQDINRGIEILEENIGNPIRVVVTG